MSYCFWYTAMGGLGTWQCSWAITGNANTTAVFAAKFNWSDEGAIFYNTMISTAAIIGLALGSFFGGTLLSIGRRRTIIVA